MPSRFRSADGRYRAENDADFVGPLRLAVGAGLAYMIWLAFRASSPSASDSYPGAQSPVEPKGS